jgi:hypothetical protein
MAWDKFKMAQKFLQRANAIHPEDALGSNEHDEALALQDVYYDCYMSSFSKDDLIKRMNAVIEGKIEMPEEKEVNEEKYRGIYVKEAKRILSDIERDHPSDG